MLRLWLPGHIQLLLAGLYARSLIPLLCIMYIVLFLFFLFWQVLQTSYRAPAPDEVSYFVKGLKVGIILFDLFTGRIRAMEYLNSLYRLILRRFCHSSLSMAFTRESKEEDIPFVMWECQRFCLLQYPKIMYRWCIGYRQFVYCFIDSILIWYGYQ